MTTNETMLELHKLIGGVEWEREGQKERLIYEHDIGMAEGWWVEDEESSWRISTYELQALIEKATIEWLHKGGRAIHIQLTDECGWCIYVFSSRGPEHAMLVDVAGHKTLLDALHAAVKAVKEHPNDNQ